MPCNCFGRQPTLTREQRDDRKTSKGIEKQIASWMKEYRKSIKILLLGAAESGKTTIIKQMKILHIKGFSDEERQAKAKEIRINLLEAIQEIVESLLQYEPHFRFAVDENDEHWRIVRAIRMQDIEQDAGFVFDEFFFSPIRSLWADSNVRQKCAYLDGYSIIDSAHYFLEKIEEIQRPDYRPTDADVLRARRRTTEIQKIEFDVKIPSKYGGGEQLFWMFDVGGQKGERRKWIQVFDGISAILFLISASEFDLMTRERSPRPSASDQLQTKARVRFAQSTSGGREQRENRMLDSLRLFRDICESRFLEFCGLICFLNKQDRLREKIVHRQCRLADYFDDYAAFEYEPKVNWLAELGQQPTQADGGRRYLQLRNYWKGRPKGGSHEGSVNSSIVLDMLATQSDELPRREEHAEQPSQQASLPASQSLQPTRDQPGSLVASASTTSFTVGSFGSTGAVAWRSSITGLSAGGGGTFTKKQREDSLRSQDGRPEAEQLALSLELEYRKARNFIKQKFVRVAEEVAEKRARRQQSVYSSSYGRRPAERECFFHYTIATDTENIRTVFDDVQVMIILNNINQTILA